MLVFIIFACCVPSSCRKYWRRSPRSRPATPPSVSVHHIVRETAWRVAIARVSDSTSVSAFARSKSSRSGCHTHVRVPDSIRFDSIRGSLIGPPKYVEHMCIFETKRLSRSELSAEAAARYKIYPNVCALSFQQ